MPGNLNVSFAGIDGEALLVSLDDIAVSSGAACTQAEPSHVLMALGLSRDRALASLRFGIGRTTTRKTWIMRSKRVSRTWSSTPPADVAGVADAATPDEVLSRVRNPQRVGTLDGAHVGTGEVGTLDEGTVVRIQVRTSGDRIAEARFKVFGCSAAIASASLVTEWLEGAPIAEAMRLTPERVVQMLGLAAGSRTRGAHGSRSGIERGRGK